MSSSLVAGSIIVARGVLDCEKFDILFQSEDLEVTTLLAGDIHWLHVEDYLRIANVYMEIDPEDEN